MPSFPCAIIGANGYTGKDLARLLLHHPNAQLVASLGRNCDWQLSDELPEAAAQHVKHYALAELKAIAAEVDTIFLATPTEISLELIPDLMQMPVNIIDLSGALRLPADDYAKWYGAIHPHPYLPSRAHYGLSPWWPQWANPKDCKLIANPGCYATCAQMALLPLLINNIIQPQRIIIDAKSGLTGAGRSPKQNLLYCEVAHDFYAYKIGAHQHTPEIQQYLSKFSQQSCQLILTTHILPLKRGISMSLYTELNPQLLEWDLATQQQKINEAFALAYQDYPLVKYGDLSQKTAQQQQQLLSLTHVVGSARTHIAWQIQGKQLVLFATIDNLLKGAASQAIENFNWIHGIPCTSALEHWEGLL